MDSTLSINVLFCIGFKQEDNLNPLWIRWAIDPKVLSFQLYIMAEEGRAGTCNRKDCFKCIRYFGRGTDIDEQILGDSQELGLST